MFFLYNLLYTLGFILMLPAFLVSGIVRGKHAAGFLQRLGFLPRFEVDGRPVIWIHAVSVGETNAARPLVEKIGELYPDHRIVVSTVTRTGQKLAKEIFADSAECVFYVPFDLRWTVRRALERFQPTTLLLMETELWFNLIREAHKAGTRIAIVNGRLSERSFERYSRIKGFMKRLLGYIDVALMQENADAARLMDLGMRASKVKVLGNIKFDHAFSERENVLTTELRERYGITQEEPLIIAASTHSPEEQWILDAFKQVRKLTSQNLPRLMIAPRHPERFEGVAEYIHGSGFSWVRRSGSPSDRDKTAEVILLDSIGELRAAYPLAEIVFVGGSLIPHGGQSIFEPASAGKAIVTGPHMENFKAGVQQFLEKGALVQIAEVREPELVLNIAAILSRLLESGDERSQLGANAVAVMNDNRGSTDRTLECLGPLLSIRQ